MSSIVLPLELDRHPINSEKIAKMKPQFKINDDGNSFQLTMYIPGFKKDDVNVYAGNGKIAVQAIDRIRFKNLNVCKVYKANYTLPKGAILANLRKTYQDGILIINGGMENKKQTKHNIAVV